MGEWACCELTACKAKFEPQKIFNRRDQKPQRITGEFSPNLGIFQANLCHSHGSQLRAGLLTNLSLDSLELKYGLGSVWWGSSASEPLYFRSAQVAGRARLRGCDAA